ncbi:helix-turn-helix domain-containing protein [Knoellia sp. LjRoot47]|uniref:helix-turn-helix domain-containing protein n=1 Tax=Knoellia sp. LjRoot47 TaxID=3342330 RepID=UPI003ECFCB83
MARTSIDVPALYSALDASRESRGMSWRQLAREIEVSPSTLSRLANDLKPDVNAFAAMLQWLRMDASAFMVGHTDDSDEAGLEPDLVAELAPLLRARKDLDGEDVRHLEELIGSAVKRFNTERAKSGR